MQHQGLDQAQRRGRELDDVPLPRLDAILFRRLLAMLGGERVADARFQSAEVVQVRRAAVSYHAPAPTTGEGDQRVFGQR